MAIYDPTLLTRSGLTPDNLWAAAGIINDNLQSIAESFERAVDGLSYQNPVIDKDLSAAPTNGITIGSRYIVAFGVTSLDPWYGHIDEIAELVDDDPYTWEFVVPGDGWWLHVVDEGIEYLYTELDWVSRPASTLHNSLAEKQGGNAEDDEYYHLTQDEVGYLPTSDQKDALAGTGTPSTENVYVTADAFATDDGHDHDGTNSRQIAWDDIDFTTSDIADITTVSHTSLSDIGSTTHADIDTYLPSSDEKDALAGSAGTPSDENVFVTETDSRLSDARTPSAHASSHIKGTAIDTIDADQLEISWDATNYTPSTCTEAGDSDHLTAHLKGIDNAIGGKAASSHTHNELPTTDEKAALVGTGTPSATNKYVTKDSLLAAIYGIGEFKDNVLDKELTAPPAVAPTLYDAYIVATPATGLWEGKENDIAKWNGTTWDFYAPTEGDSTYVADEDLIYVYIGTLWQAINNFALASSEPGAVSSSTSGQTGTNTTVARSDHNHDLGAHSHTGVTDGGALGYAASDHDGTHVTSGTDEIDGDKLDIDFTPASYTPATVENIADNVDNLSAHLKGIDTALSNVGVADNSITLAKLDHGTQGDILYYTTDGAPARLGTGDSGQALLSGGAGANPSWQTVATSTIVTITAGENLALNDVVYVKTSDGKYYKADKDAEESADAVGITLAIISQNATGDIAVGSKLVTNVTWSWTPGSVLYLSGTQGAITATLPTTGYVKPLGYAITATQILFMPLTGWPADSGASAIDGDKVVIDYNPTNTTPTVVTETDTIDQLSSHLKGLDLFAGTKAQASGIASLDSSSKVVQDPANATSTPTASKIPIADGSGKLDSWISIQSEDVSSIQNTLTMIAWDTYSEDRAFDDIYVDDFTDATGIDGTAGSGGVLSGNSTGIYESVNTLAKSGVAAGLTVDVTTSQIDCSSWGDINSVAITQTTPTGTASNSAIYHAVSFDNAVTYKAFKTDVNAFLAMSAASTPSPQVASASGNYSGFNPWKAFKVTENQTDDGWLSNSGSFTAGAGLASLMLDFGSAICINKYRWYRDNNTTEAFPKTWKLQGTNNVAATASDAINDNGWTDLDTQTNYTCPATTHTWSTYWSFSNTTAYRYYRLRITATQASAIYVNVARLSLVAANHWLTVAYNNSGTWQYNAAGTLTNASTNSLAGALSQSTAQSAYQWTKTNIEAMDDADWNATGGWSTSVTTVDWAKVLVNSAPEDEAPTFTKATINYDTDHIALDLRSNGWEASANDPTAAYCVLDIEPVDAITYNTDVLAYASIDNGSNYEQITLETTPFREIGDHDYVRGDLSGITARTDKTIRIKVTSANSKALKCHAWAVGVKY